MEKFAWKAFIKPGKKEEYIRLHDEIWPEMKTMLHDAGIRNYTIWNIEDELFGYYECDDLEKAERVQSESDVDRKWDIMMEPLMTMIVDPETGQPLRLTQVFRFD